ncbi:hypothetical protein [Actinoplanes auranticolor]|uniref:Uncharacterized protein n=1 Tax=Actinoplanes auranticolor TaxID=47988 RepID=A0A919SSL8_9ACTN|nr:hypothetical protein [Actinoplanes auranticolor]GIM77189.1 hypothetical protein Aau02nite_74690 [Actinoplanes auranticolor]
MESTGAKQRNDRSAEWSVPRQERRAGNAGKWLSGAGAAPDARPGATSSINRAPGQRGPERGRPALPAIIAAVEEMREDRPRIDVGGLYQQFRCRGGRWALVTREDVRVALAGIECTARRKFAAPRAEGASPRRTARTPHGAWPQFREAVTELRDSGADLPGIVRWLRAADWQVSQDDVAGALRRIKAANAPRHFLPGQSLPAPRPTGPGICPSCEAPVTELGLCRCS